MSYHLEMKKEDLCFWCFVVNDTLDDILAESGDEEESDKIVTQVLDEIGIEISGKVCINNDYCFLDH